MKCPNCERRLRWWYLRCRVCRHNLAQFYIVTVLLAIASILLLVRFL